MESFQSIIGIEIHIELKTASKMFCGCSADHFAKKPNTLCCPVCLGLPGALPVPNRKAVEWTLMAGLALGCQIPKESKFDRKNYFYPDLPKGYQISQYDQPLAINGKLRTVRIRRVHLEEDTGKLIHEQGATLIDFNRAGVPLMEIVTEPDINSSNEAKDFLEKLQQLIRYLGISEADMEKGQMRCEPTVNLKIGQSKHFAYTPLTEIKNINSFRFVKKAIDFEIGRQLEEYKRTGIEKQFGNKMTRGWNEKREVTILQRGKEEAADYRYFPEPDIPPIRWTKDQLSAISYQLSAIELPDQKQERFIKQYDLSDYQAGILTATREVAEYFEEGIKEIKGVKKDKRGLIQLIANWIINKRIDVIKVSPKKLMSMISQSLEKKELPSGQLKKAIKKILRENKKAVADYKNGKGEAIMFLVGQVMKEIKAKADPQKIKEMIELLLVID